MDTVGWGVIGAGGIAARRTIPGILSDSPSTRLIALFDTNPSVTEDVARRFQIPRACSDMAELLSCPDVKAIYVASPPNVHLEQVQAAAEAGKHVFVEKPIALDVLGAQILVDICKRAGVKLGVGFMMRFNGYNQQARKLVAAGDVGNIVAGRAQLTCWYPTIPGAWRQDPSLGGGGCLIDMGCHCIDLLEFIIGSRTESVLALNQSLVQDYTVEDTSTVILRMKNGAQCVVDTMFNVPDAASRGLLEIYGTGGALYGEGTIGQAAGGRIEARLSSQGSYDAQQGREESARTFQLQSAEVNPYGAEIEAFSQAILDDTHPPVPGEQGLWNQRIIEACYESARCKEWISVDSG